MEKGANNYYPRSDWPLIFFWGLMVAGLPLLTTLPLAGQSSYSLRLLPLDTTAEFLDRQVKYQENLADTAAIFMELRQILDRLHGRAFLEASVDTIDCRDSTCLAILHIGPKYQWAALQNGNVQEAYLDQVGFRERLFRDEPFSAEELTALQEELLVFAENHGHPFARVWLDSIRLTPGNLSARLFMDPGARITMDTITLEGDARISRRYLESYLGLRPGTLYNQNRILRSRERLRELPFLSTSSDPTVAFSDDRASLRVDLRKRNASRFDFLIGILPNSNQTGRMLITGSFEGELINQFGRGERIYAKFEQLRPQTQLLDLQFNYPYFLNTPIGIDTRFNLYKRDTSYFDLRIDLGLQLLLEGGNYLKAFWNNYSSTLLTVDERQLEQQQRLPPTLDVTNTTFGLEFLYQRLDYRYNPRRGWAVFIRGGAGVKTTRRNNTVEELGYGYLYDSLELRTFQVPLLGRLEAFVPLFTRSTIKFAANAGFLLSPQPIYLNEQFRIGGNRLLRGFDEEFIFASQYTVGTVEYRLLIGPNSFLYTFGDFSWVVDRTTQTDTVSYPYGFGAGITFETKVGLFGVSLAFGAVGGEPVDFARPKVHFGYVSRF